MDINYNGQNYYIERNENESDYSLYNRMMFLAKQEPKGENELKEESRYSNMWINKKLLGCGALKFLDNFHGEFKSIRVHDNFRNKGNGIKVIDHLILKAKILNIKRISIETGASDFFIPARKLFKKCKFEPCEPFAHYKEDLNSIYLTKLISNY